MKIKNLLLLASLVLGVSVFTSCDKAETIEPLDGKGQTLVKFTHDYELINVEFIPADQNVILIDLRRDVWSNADLNKEMKVVITEDFGIASAYDPGLNPFPAGFLTVNPADAVRVGNNLTVTLKPGEFAKEIRGIVKNANTINLSSRYATGFKISTVDADGKIAAAPRTIVVEIGAKNQWDGIYNIDWCNYHPSLNATYSCSTSVVHMITSGANKVKIWWPAAGTYTQPSVLGGGLSYFLNQEPEYTINVATNQVTVLNSFNAPNPPPTQYTMAVGFNHRYDAAAKTFYTKWGYSYAVPGVYDPGCREWTQTIRYLGPR